MKSLYHRNGRPLDTDPKAGRVRPARMRHILHGGLALLLTAALAFVPCALAEPGDLPEEPVGSESFPPAEDGYVTVASTAVWSCASTKRKPGSRSWTKTGTSGAVRLRSTRRTTSHSLWHGSEWPP